MSSSHASRDIGKMRVVALGGEPIGVDSAHLVQPEAREALPRAVKLRYRVAPVTKQAVKGVF